MKIVRVGSTLFKIVLWAFVILVPTLGVWVASSLAAYLNGPIWLACLAGLLLFPAVPLGWDLWATKRFQRKEEARRTAGKEPRERIVTFSDRLILRTFVLNIGFLAALLATFPQVGFTSLATRGDWFLETVDSPLAEQVRPALFTGAEGLAWLYELTLDNPYAREKGDEPLPTPTGDEFGEVVRVDPKPTAPDVPTVPDAPTAPDAPTVPEVPAVPDAPEIVAIDAPVREPGHAPAWPMEATLHPLVTGMPAAIETDYASVAQYIKKHEDDPFLRVKALNDYVTHRIAYDYPALRSGEYPPSDPKKVFDRKMGVCAGYARLLEAMGKVTGDEIVYVTGVARDLDGAVSGAGHAWNAAKIEGKWYLVDPTWNDGDFETGEDKYTTNYLFTPPAVFGTDHLPDAEEWQLRPDPITRGEFMRQPILPPEFHAQQLKLVSPQRSQIEARGGSVSVTLENPRLHTVLASTTPVSGGTTDRCTVTGRKSVQITCKVPHGTHRLKLFAGPSDLTMFPFVAQFEVTAR